VYVRELHARYRRRRLYGWTAPLEALRSPKDAAPVFASIMRDEVVEVGGVLCLSARHHVLAYGELSRGSVDSTPMHPRDIFKVALLANAAAVIVGHNHPSGDITPSADDRAVTARIAAAGVTLGIDLVDHIIVAADGTYFSFKEAALL